jgi:hypothetical protein
MLILKRNDLLRVVSTFCTIVLANQFESLLILGIQYLTRSLFNPSTPTHPDTSDYHRNTAQTASDWRT